MISQIETAFDPQSCAVPTWCRRRFWMRHRWNEFPELFVCPRRRFTGFAFSRSLVHSNFFFSLCYKIELDPIIGLWRVCEAPDPVFFHEIGRSLDVVNC